MSDNTLITGVTGFLGNNLARKLLDQSYSPRIVGIARSKLSKYDKEKLGFSNDVIVRYGDITDYSFVDSVINKYEIDTIYHLAANAVVRTAQRSPLRCFESNIKGTWNILESARQNGTVKSIVVSESDKSYGQTPKLPYTEEMKLCPSAPYETSKACAGLLAMCYYKTYDLPVVTFRSANVFGPKDLNFSRLIPNSCRKIINLEPPIIWKDVSEYKREFIFIEDVTTALILLSDYIYRTKGNVYNVGTGITYKVKDLVDRLCRVSGVKISPTFPEKEIPFKEIPEQYLSLDKIKKDINWRAKYTLDDFDGCLKKTFGWFNEYFS